MAPMAPAGVLHPTLFPISAPPDGLALAFVNTRYWRGSPAQTETLSSCADWLEWIAGNLGYRAGAVHEIGAWAQQQPAKAARLFEAALALREALFRAFSAIAAEQPVPDADLALINELLVQASPRHALVAAGSGYAWRGTALKPGVPVLLAPVLWSAADLITRGAQRRIRQCANPKCLWLFIDESKSGTRRWCDMGACGNRAKAQRHYLKSKGQQD